jgi:thiol-disulfide isomerase/thioredoxin
MKKYFNIILIIPLFLLLFISACDKIEPPYKSADTDITDTLPKRKFLLEEFTGHTCPNCPQGAVVAQQLKSLYGERLVIFSIHYADFAEPGTGEFANDFRSATGTEIGNFFSPQAFPSGLVCRTGWTSSQNLAVLDKDAWGAKMESLKNIAPLASIELTNTYESSTRTVNTSLEVDALQNMSGTYKIAAYITEDSIVAAQVTQNDVNYPDNIIHNYVHRHVLRGAMNSTWGDTLVSGNATTGDQFYKNYSTILNAGWNENHCYVVAFIYDVTNYEIIQVEEKRVKYIF